MTTVGDLISDISFRMHSYTGLREATTYLTSAVGSTDTVLNVASGDRISRGYIEVEQELMLVDSVEGNSVKLPPFGRGQEGSGATAHDANVQVTNDPLLPAVSVLRALQDTVLQVHPDLFQVKSTSVTYQGSVVTYPLPMDVDRVLQVSAPIPGPSGLWPRLDAWNFDKAADTNRYPSGKTIDIYGGVTPGYAVRVVYAGPYTTPQSFTDDLSALGIQDSVKEVLLLGTCWRICQMLESSRLQMQGIEQFARQEAVPAGSETNLARQLYAMYSQRMAEERRRLLALHPAQIHRTR